MSIPWGFKVNLIYFHYPTLNLLRFSRAKG